MWDMSLCLYGTPSFTLLSYILYSLFGKTNVGGKPQGVSFMCPLCRQNFNLPAGGVQSFKVYPFSIDTKISTSNEDGIVCELCCDEKRAIAKCIDCNSNLCLDCCEYHGKLKTSHNHKIEKINSVKGKSNCGVKQEKECNEHQENLVLFCKQCNSLICVKCRELKHSKHKSESVYFMSQVKRNVLLMKTAILKSRIPILENGIEDIKMEESKHYKVKQKVKKEIQSRATGIKEVFCRTIDVLATKQMQNVDEGTKTNIKIVQTYKDELERDMLSLTYITRTADHLLKTYSDCQIMTETIELETQLDRNLLKDSVKDAPKVNHFSFECGKLDDCKIEELFGKVVKTEGIKIEEHDFLPLPLPKTDYLPEIISSFQAKNEVLGIIPTETDVWIVTKDLMELYNSDGILKKTSTPPDKFESILWKKDDGVWFWKGDHAIKGNSGEESGYQVCFENGIACCFRYNGNLLVYNPSDKILYDVDKQGNVERTITNEKLQATLTNEHMKLSETKYCNLVFSQCHTTVIVTDQNGIIINTFEENDGKIKAFCADKFGNILVAATNFENDFIAILFEDGHFRRYLFGDHIYGVKHMTVDASGNLWFSNESDRVCIYSFI